MERRTILYVGGFELPDKNAAAQRVLTVGKLLRDLGYKVVFLGVSRTLSPDASLDQTKSEALGFESWAIRYPDTTIDWIRHISSAAAVRELIERHYRDEVLAVICYNHPALAQHWIQRLCRRIGVAHISDATEWYDSVNETLLARIGKRVDTAFRMHVIHTRANGVIATSRFLAEFYRARHSTVVEVPTLCDEAALSRVPALLRERTAKTLYFLYAGTPFHITRLDEERNNLKDRLDEVVSLMGRMHARNLRFVLEICGITRENYLLAFPEHAELIRNLSDSIVFLGRRTHGEVIARTKACDFTIFLRRASRMTLAGFPTKFAESISCGTPVIANALSNISGYLHDGVNGFVLDINDPDAQVLTMLRIFALDRASLDSMRRNCLAAHALDYRSFLKPVRAFMSAVAARGRPDA